MLLDRLFGPRKYVSVSYTEETQQNLRAWCLDRGIDLTVNYDGAVIEPEEFYFNTTLLLSTSRHKHILDRDVHVRARVEQLGIGRFGKKNAGLGLRVKSSKLARMRRIFEIHHHMVDTWSIFDPHISLSYRHEGALPYDMPEFPLVIESLKVEDVCPKNQMFSNFKIKVSNDSIRSPLPS